MSHSNRKGALISLFTLFSAISGCTTPTSTQTLQPSTSDISLKNPAVAQARLQSLIDEKTSLVFGRLLPKIVCAAVAAENPYTSTLCSNQGSSPVDGEIKGITTLTLLGDSKCPSKPANHVTCKKESFIFIHNEGGEPDIGFTGFVCPNQTHLTYSCEQGVAVDIPSKEFDINPEELHLTVKACVPPGVPATRPNILHKAMTARCNDPDPSRHFFK